MTLYSMTGYAKVAKEGFAIEVRSYNRKHLDLELCLPSFLQPFYSQFQRIIEEFSHRGKIILTISPQANASKPMELAPNLEAAHQIVTAWREVGRHLNLNVESHLPYLLGKSAELIVTQSQVEPADEVLQTLLFSLLKKVLLSHQNMRREEGSALEKDFIFRLDLAAKIVEDIKKREPFQKETIENRINEKFSHLNCIEEALKKELASLIDKSDIQEEVIRFSSHLAQMHAVIRGESEGKGKKLEFILQEMLREANTIGSKACDIEMTYRVIELKTEIERMREQVLNVE